jgi:hypothetical protein
MKLSQITIEPKASNESFVSGNTVLNFNITDFWKWNLSDLIGNTNIMKYAFHVGFIAFHEFVLLC